MRSHCSFRSALRANCQRTPSATVFCDTFCPARSVSTPAATGASGTAAGITDCDAEMRREHSIPY
jgi:hypothetical protein